MADTTFIRSAATITPELIARFGAKWHGAINKPAVANVLRSAVIQEDICGLAESYDRLADKSQKDELTVVTRILRSGQHAARQHRERTAACVRELFAQTPPDNLALRHVKLTVFGVPDGKPIMHLHTHPFFEAMNNEYDGPAEQTIVTFETDPGDYSIMDQCALPKQKEFAAFLGKFLYFFHCILTSNNVFRPVAANLFHFKLEQDKYSIKPEDYGKKPLIFDKNDLTSSTYLNDFFFYVFQRFCTWQGMKSQSLDSANVVDILVRSNWAEHPASGTSNWRPALPEIHCVSKMMVAYLASFLGVSPFKDTQD